LFSEALSPQGRLELVRGRFWHHGMYASSEDLRSFWNHRDDLAWTPESILAVVASEAANGNLEEHPWCVVMLEGEMPAVLSNAFQNVGELFERAEQFGANTEALLDAVGYILVVSLWKLRAAATIDCIRAVWKTTGDGRPTSQRFRDRVEKDVVVPIINHVRDTLCDACSDGCERVELDRNRLSDDDVAGFWKRFVHQPDRPVADERMKARVSAV
jgi:hypothetical protein